MNIRQLRDLAIKLLGLYLMAHGLLNMVQFVHFFDLSGRSGVRITSQKIVILGFMLPVAVYLLFAGMLLFATRLVARCLWPVKDETDIQAPALPFLATGVSLLGLYFLLASLGGLVSRLWTFGVEFSQSNHLFLLPAVPDVVGVVLGLACIFKAKAIADFLGKRAE
jgi:hypothetical protein